MTTTTGEEVPFLSGMERKGDEARDDLQADVERLGRDVFSAHGMVEKLKQTVTEFVSYIRSMRSDRYVDPDAAIKVPAGIVIDKETLHELIKNSRFQREHTPSNGNGGINGTRQSWLRDAAIVVTLGLSAWTLKTVIDQGKDITRMQCQLSPSTCLQVTSRGP